MSEEAQVLEAVQEIDVDALGPGEAGNLLSKGLEEQVEAEVTANEELVAEETVEEEAEPMAEEETTEEPAESKIEALQKQIEHMQKFIAKQSNEVGKVRQLEKQLEDLRASKPTADEDIGIDNFIDDPKEALKKVMKEQEAERLEQDLTRRIQQEKSIEQNKAVLEEAAPDIAEVADPIAELLIKDGASPEVAESFKRNIYAQNPVVAFNLYQRVQLQNKINELEGKVKRPAKVLQNVKSAAKRGPTVTARSGSSAPQQGLNLTEEMIESMTPDQVKEALSAIRNQ